MSRPVVLNTRARDQASELSRLLRQAGFDVVEAPAIQIVPAWDATELDRVRAGLRSGLFDCVVLASQNAGRELVRELPQSQARLVCGASTASALGLARVTVALERFSAARALEAMQPLLDAGQRVLVPRAAEGREELVDGLCGLGAVVDSPIAYRTVAADAAAARLRAGGIDVVTLCSPSAVRSVSAALTEHVAVVCLGETTAAAARAHGVRVDAMASTTSMAALVAAVESLLGARR